MKKSLLLICLALFGVTSCNTTEQSTAQPTQQPATKKSQPVKRNTPSCPADDPCDTDPCK